MSTRTVEACDICGQEKTTSYRARVKLSRWCCSSRNLFGFWSKLDLCNDCQKAFVEFAQSKKSVDEKELDGELRQLTGV